MRLATVLVGPANAHDLVVDTVQRVVRRADWSTIDRPGAYLSRAIVNAATSAKRSAIRREEREARASRLVIVQSVDPTNVVDVHRALGRLTPQQRAIVYFTYWEDLSIPEVARRLDIHEGTVRKQIVRAKERLREVLK